MVMENCSFENDDDNSMPYFRSLFSLVHTEMSCFLSTMQTFLFWEIKSFIIIFVSNEALESMYISTAKNFVNEKQNMKNKFISLPAAISTICIKQYLQI